MCHKCYCAWQNNDPELQIKRNIVGLKDQFNASGTIEERALHFALHLLALDQVVTRASLKTFVPDLHSRAFNRVEQELQYMEGVQSFNVAASSSLYTTRMFVLRGSAPFAAADRERLVAEADRLNRFSTEVRTKLNMGAKQVYFVVQMLLWQFSMLIKTRNKKMFN